ncbi:hypothetical protein HDU84_004531 [Entophlyctis sp. JEL0112]|nr:hypothetical protein HDU84_004531 [Entophlyctis sp. JEL0112]
MSSSGPATDAVVAAIGESVASGKPLVLTLAEGSAPDMSDVFDRSRCVCLSVPLDSASAEQFLSVFPLVHAQPGSGVQDAPDSAASAARESVHVIARGARVALLTFPATRDRESLAAFAQRNGILAGPQQPSEPAPRALPAAHDDGARAGEQQPPSREPDASDARLPDPDADADAAAPAAEPPVVMSLKFSTGGAVVKARFTPSQTLADVRAHIVRAGFVADFELVQPYPTHAFTREEELYSVLSELGFSRAGSLVVRKIAAKKSRQPPPQQRKMQEVGATKEPEIISEKKDPLFASLAIRINLPNQPSSTLRSTFAVTDTLTTVRDHVARHLNSSKLDSAFDISQVYPTRLFSVEDETKSLKDLDLVPSATLLVKPLLNSTDAYPRPSGNILSRMYMPILVWLMGIFTWIFTPRISLSSSSTSREGVSGSASSSRGANTERKQNVASLSDLRKKQDADSEDNTTYNGNSTAQDF